MQQALQGVITQEGDSAGHRVDTWLISDVPEIADNFDRPHLSTTTPAGCAWINERFFERAPIRRRLPLYNSTIYATC